MVSNLEEYKWSSHCAYLGLDEFAWISKDKTHALCETEDAESLPDFVNEYSRYVNASDADAKDQLDAIRLSSKLGAFGDRSFLKSYTDVEVDELELSLRFVMGKSHIALSDLIRFTCERFKVSEEQLCGISRDAVVVTARAVLALAATKTKLVSLSSLAVRLSRDHSSLSRLRNKAKSEGLLMEAADELCNRLVVSATSA